MLRCYNPVVFDDESCRRLEVSPHGVLTSSVAPRKMRSVHASRTYLPILLNKIGSLGSKSSLRRQR